MSRILPIKFVKIYTRTLKKLLGGFEMGSSRLTAYYITEIIRKHRGECDILKQADILKYLKNEYGLDISRRTLYDYLVDLRLDGIITEDNRLSSVESFDNMEKRFFDRCCLFFL